MRCAIAICAAALLSGCDKPPCDTSNLHVGSTVQEVFAACGKPESINYYPGDADEQWAYFHHLDLTAFHIEGGKVMWITRPDDIRADPQTVRIYP